MTLSKVPARLLFLLLFLFSASARADALADILERGSIRVGVAEFAPWTLRTRSGGLIGYEIDVANKIADDMGVKPEFKVYEWEQIIPALQRGEIDVIAGGMAITPGRALQVNFTRPVATSGVGLATHTKMTANINTLEELDSEKIVISTVAETLASSVTETLFENAEIRVFPTSELAEKEILEGRAHAYLASMPAATFLSLKNPEVVDLPIVEPLVASSEALAVRKGEQELLNFLNAWVVVRSTDKWLASTRDYWFGTLSWVADVTE